jgi:hypothetical protein
MEGLGHVGDGTRPKRGQMKRITGPHWMRQAHYRIARQIRRWLSVCRWTRGRLEDCRKIGCIGSTGSGADRGEAKMTGMNSADSSSLDVQLNKSSSNERRTVSISSVNSGEHAIAQASDLMRLALPCATRSRSKRWLVVQKSRRCGFGTER